MKLSTTVLLLGSTFTFGANLVARQGTCSDDNCFRAVWGTSRGADHPLTALRHCMSRLTTTVAVHPITTVTLVARTTATAIVFCSTTLSGSSTSGPSNSASSLPKFTFPTPTLISTGSVADRVKARQNEILSSSTTTIIGPIPIYAGDNCFNPGSVYASICSCKIITSDILTKLSTTLTSTDTLTLTSTVTSTASCSSSIIITLSHSSSTTITTATLTFSTGTGTIPVSPTLSSSSSSSTDTVSPSVTSSSRSSTAFNGTMASSATLIPSSTTVNTTSASSTTSTIPTSSCPVEGYILCSGTCIDARNSTSNCGSCGNSCGDGLVCFNGVCARPPIQPPCDSNCTFDRLCNQGPNRPEGGCICARDEAGYGICFDKNRYRCGRTDLDVCYQTGPSNNTARPGCSLGHVCIKSICANTCSDPGVPEAAQRGICVSTERCGNDGPTLLGPLMRIGEQEQRKRVVKESNW